MENKIRISVNGHDWSIGLSKECSVAEIGSAFEVLLTAFDYDHNEIQLFFLDKAEQVRKDRMNRRVNRAKIEDDCN